MYDHVLKINFVTLEDKRLKSLKHQHVKTANVYICMYTREILNVDTGYITIYIYIL